MDDIPLALKNLIDKAVNQLDQAGLSRSLVKEVKDLVEAVHQPCKVAVVGKIKVGKSTFVNTLLGEKLAMVGVEETTATLNYFLYDTPNPGDTVRCYWKNKKGFTNESRKDLEELLGKGYDREVLKRAAEIDHLEYDVRDGLLKHITLIDTPGVGGLQEHHEHAMGVIAEHLRKSHDIATHKATNSEADVVIYLMDATPDRQDEELLEEFRRRTQGQERVMNAIGVIARIDQDQSLVRRRGELATTAANRLQKSLNTVLTVSAQLEQQLGELERQIEPLAAAIRSIPENNLDALLTAREVFNYTLDMHASASSPHERQLLRSRAESLGWGVFETFARLAADKADLSGQELMEELKEIAGFARLRKLLENLFVKDGQGRWLRYYQIVRTLREILGKVKYEYRWGFVNEEAARKKQREAFLDYLKCLKDPLARELEAFVEEQLAPHLDPKLIADGIERELSEIEETLNLHHGDIVARQWLEDHSNLFSCEEKEELCKLLSYYTRDMSERLQDRKYVKDRKKYWTQKSRLSNDPIVCQIATQAARRYTSILHSFP